ncbi:MAG: SDR family NAD(P)-dependent oxidoreductase [Myxococcota bacterium]
MELRGRTALITGASRGLGPHIATALALEGMDLVIAARSEAGLTAVADELRPTGRRVVCVPTDLSDPDSLEALVERAEQEDGGIDLLVNNAGLEHTIVFEEIPVSTIDQIISVNLRAPMVLSRLLLPRLVERGRGHIVNVSSVAGYTGLPHSEPYCATKAALVGFSRAFRASAKACGYPVGCSVVSPGFVSNAGMYDDMVKDYGVTAPALLGTSSPKDVAQAVVRAAKRDIPEVIVNPTPVRPLAVLAILLPRLASWLVERLGVAGVIGTVAKARTQLPGSKE